MQKRGHIYVTKQALTLCSEYKGWILLGSIFPDLMVHTLLKGHTYQVTSRKFFRMIHKLEAQGTMNPWHSFQLGMVLHYVEDYFTLPHNEQFQGGLLAHSLYEEQQYAVISGQSYQENTEHVGTGNISDWIRRKHMEYVQEKHAGADCDSVYIMEVANQVMNYFAYEFRINEATLRMKQKFTGNIPVTYLRSVK